MTVVRDYLEELGGQSREEFVRAHPAWVLITVEGGGSSQAGAGPTEHLDTHEVQKRSINSQSAMVYLVPVGDTPLTIGRGESCDITVAHNSVSKEHARLSHTPEGLLLEDLGSTNGTAHNHSRLQPHQRVRLLPDDSVTFGKSTALHLLDPPSFYDYLQLLRRFAL